jgi:hypothetical protein
VDVVQRTSSIFHCNRKPVPSGPDLFWEEVT